MNCPVRVFEILSIACRACCVGNLT